MLKLRHSEILLNAVLISLVIITIATLILITQMPKVFRNGIYNYINEKDALEIEKISQLESAINSINLKIKSKEPVAIVNKHKIHNK